MTTETPPDTERRLSNLEGQTTQIGARLGDMNENITRLNTDMNENITRLSADMNGRFSDVNGRFSDMNARFSAMEESNNARFSALENKIDGLRNILIVASAGIIGALIAAIATFVLTAD